GRDADAVQDLGQIETLGQRQRRPGLGHSGDPTTRPEALPARAGPSRPGSMRSSRRTLPDPRGLLEPELEDVDEAGGARRRGRLLEQRLPLERIEVEMLAEEVDECRIVDVAIERPRRRGLPAEPLEVPMHQPDDALARPGRDAILAVLAPRHVRLAIRLRWMHLVADDECREAAE